MTILIRGKSVGSLQSVLSVESIIGTSNKLASTQMLLSDRKGCNTAGARERRRQQVESVPEEADEPGVDRVGDLGCLPPPPLVNGLRPGPGHTASARPAQPASAPVSKPVSRHTEEQKQPAPARSERSQHQAEVSQRAQVAAKSTQPAPAQQAPAEHGASPPVPPAKERPGTLLEAIMSSRHQQAAPATKVLPTEPTPPIHSPLGPPVSGKSGLLPSHHWWAVLCREQLCIQTSPATRLLFKD